MATTTLTYSQRLALAVHSAKFPMAKANFPYGFETYAKVAAKTNGRKLDSIQGYYLAPGEVA